MNVHAFALGEGEGCSVAMSMESRRHDPGGAVSVFRQEEMADLVRDRAAEEQLDLSLSLGR